MKIKNAVFKVLFSFFNSIFIKEDFILLVNFHFKFFFYFSYLIIFCKEIFFINALRFSFWYFKIIHFLFTFDTNVDPLAFYLIFLIYKFWYFQIYAYVKIVCIFDLVLFEWLQLYNNDIYATLWRRI